MRAMTGFNLEVNITVNGVATEAVLDTAAHTTIISEDFAAKLPEPLDYTQPVKLVGVSSEMIFQGQKAKVRLKFGNTEVIREIIVAPINDPVLLGIDIMQEGNCVLDIVRNLLHIHGEILDITVRQGNTETQVRRVTVAHRVRIPAETAMSVEVKVDDGDSDGMLLLEPLLTADSKYTMMPALVNGKGPIRVDVYNFSQKAVRLKAGLPLAMADGVDRYAEKLVHPTDTAHSVRAVQEPASEITPKTDETCIQVNETEPKPRPVQYTDARNRVHEGVTEAELILSEIPGNWTEKHSQIQARMPEYLTDMYERSLEGLTDEQACLLGALILEFKDVFSKNDWDFGHITVIKHPIHLDGPGAICMKMRRTPKHYEKDEEKHIQELLHYGVIRPSHSQFAAAPVLVRKRDKSLRYCIDYRNLNLRTIKDKFPLPNIQLCLEALADSEWYSCLDMCSGYYQLDIEPEDCHKTAFLTRFGLFEHVKLGFGLCNAPATYQRAMQIILDGLLWRTALCFLDDVSVLGKTFTSHIDNLRGVFERIREHGGKLKPRKCKFCRKETEFLGRLVTPDGLKITKSKENTARFWPIPQTSREVDSFLGFMNYHRDHIRGFADISMPLYQIGGKNQFQWGEEQQKAFDKLKEMVLTAPCLAYPKADGRFILDTDASDTAVGAALSQIQDGKERVIAFGSNVLTPEQRRYCTTRKELLAIIKFTRQYRHYLCGARFAVRTDHGSLVWLMRFKNGGGQLARWR